MTTTRRVAPLRISVVLASFAALALAGCDCTGTLGGDPCESDGDCDDGLSCVDGRCTPDGEDAGRRRDAGRPSGCATDADGDGICADEDCDDGDADRGGAERCGDEVDNDCDGETDEGFSTLCPGCEPGCSASSHPPPGGWMPTEENAEGVIVDDGGALTLGRDMVTAFSVWIANDVEATVSKLDSRTGAELARYPSVGTVIVGGGDVRPGLHNRPSRTAVDQAFDAYVANRAHVTREDGVTDFNDQGSVTKYANRERDCVDRNVNGVIDTSRDIDGNGVIDVASAEYVGVDDECILWTSTTGAPLATPRALSIGIAPPDGLVGDVWVGLFHQQQACRLESATGNVLACMDIAGFNTYGMASDSADRVWLVDRSGARRDVLGYIDATLMTFTPVSPMPGAQCAIPYGVTVDAAGDVFLANQCDPSVWRYRLSEDLWTAVESGSAAPSGYAGTPRGVAADEQFLWVASSHRGDQFTDPDPVSPQPDNRVFQHRLSDLSLVATHTIPTGRGPVGVGVSFDGSIWAICQVNDIAARLEPTTGAWTEHPTGAQPYTYSDFIGFGLNVFAEPRGRYAFVVEGCENGVNTWHGAEYDAEVPPGTSVTIFARTAPSIAELDAATWIGPFTTNPADFSMAPGPVGTDRYLQIELRLATMDRTAAPRVFGIDVAGSCEPIID